MKKVRLCEIIKWILSVILICILLGVSIFYGKLSYIEYEPVWKADMQKKAIKEVAVKEENISVSKDRVIDFQLLQQINEDVAGWIYIPDTSIDYPILIGSTDTEYLEKDMEGNKSRTGCIFALSHANHNLSDARTLLFGHNMRQHTMFGELKRYLEDDFRNTHRKIYIYTEKWTMELEVFSVFVCTKTDDIFWKNPLIDSVDYQDLLLELDERNQYMDIKKAGIEYYYHNQMFSLITCKGNAGSSDRLVVNAIMTDNTYNA